MKISIKDTFRSILLVLLVLSGTVLADFSWEHNESLLKNFVPSIGRSSKSRKEERITPHPAWVSPLSSTQTTPSQHPAASGHTRYSSGSRVPPLSLAGFASIRLVQSPTTSSPAPEPRKNQGNGAMSE